MGLTTTRQTHRNRHHPRWPANLGQQASRADRSRSATPAPSRRSLHEHLLHLKVRTAADGPRAGRDGVAPSETVRASASLRGRDRAEAGGRVRRCLERALRRSRTRNAHAARAGRVKVSARGRRGADPGPAPSEEPRLSSPGRTWRESGAGTGRGPWHPGTPRPAPGPPPATEQSPSAR